MDARRGADFVASPPVPTDGLIQNLWLGAWAAAGAALGGAGATSDVCVLDSRVFPQQVPVLAGELQRQAHDNPLKFEVTGGQFRGSTYVKKLAPGMYSEVKVSPPGLQVTPVCLPESEAHLPSLYYKTSPPYSEWHDSDTPTKFKGNWPPTHITGAAKHLANLAFKGIFPPELLKNSKVRGDIDLYRPDNLTVKKPAFHRDGLGESYDGLIPIGQLFVFMGEDTTQEALTVRTEWMFDPETKQMWHSGPLTQGFDSKNQHLRRFTLSAPRKIVEATFPGLDIPELRALDQPVLDTSELGRLRWAGGGDEYYLRPGEIAVQAINSLPTLREAETV